MKNRLKWRLKCVEEDLTRFHYKNIWLPRQRYHLVSLASSEKISQFALKMHKFTLLFVVVLCAVALAAAEPKKHGEY